MHNNLYIRKFLAVLLLAIFLLSNTPTLFLHKLFANHNDFVSKTLNNSNSDTPQLGVSGINCHCDNLVVISPYIAGSALASKQILRTFAPHTVLPVADIPFFQRFFFELRGPPALV